MIQQASTRKRLDAAIEVVNDCFDELCKAETRDGVKRIDKRLSGSSNESKLENRIKRLERLMKKQYNIK